MKILKFVEKIACKHNIHHWDTPQEGEMLRSKGGIMMGTVTLGNQICTRCPESREVFHAASLQKFFQDGSGWKPVTEKVRKALEDGFVPLNHDLKTKRTR